MKTFEFEVFLASIKLKLPKIPLEKTVSVEILLFPPDGRMHDVDNRARACLNALQAANVLENDYQVQILHLERREVVLGGRCEITITVLG